MIDIENNDYTLYYISPTNNTQADIILKDSYGNDVTFDGNDLTLSAYNFVDGNPTTFEIGIRIEQGSNKFLNFKIYKDSSSLPISIYTQQGA